MVYNDNGCIPGNQPKKNRSVVLMKKLELKDLIFQAMIAAIYFVFTIILKPISYGYIQFRISELLIILILFAPKHLIGITLGCFIANFFGDIPVFDVPFGTLATLLSGILIILFKRKIWTLIFPVILNGVIIGLVLFYGLSLTIPIYYVIGYVALGELAVLTLGAIIYSVIKDNPILLNILK